MTREGAQEAINAAAIVTAGIYLYRKLIEPPAPGDGPTALPRRSAPGQPAGPLALRELAAIESAWGPQPSGLRSLPGQVLFGVGPVAPVPRFVVGWGFTFIVLSLVAQAQPGLGGWMALLIATGAVLGNGAKVGRDIDQQLSHKRSGPRGAAIAASGSSPTVTVSYGGGSLARVHGSPMARPSQGTPA